MTEREMLIRAYEGISEIPIQDFAKMIGKTYVTVRNRFKKNIKRGSSGYVIVRNLKTKNL